MSIIDSLSAGYRFVGRRVELLLIPILLDLVLWLSPQLSIAPIMQRLAGVYTQMSTTAGMPAGFDEISAQTSEMITLMGESTNLLAALVSSSFLHVPSIIGALAPAATQNVIAIESSWVALLGWAGFALIGLFVGVLYMELLARVLPLGAGSKDGAAGALLQRTVRHFGKVVIFTLLLFALFVVLAIPLSAFLGLLFLISPGVGSLVLAMAGGVFFVAFVYLYFVTAAIVLDDLGVLAAMGQSVTLVRRNFFPVVGFALLVTLIGIGIGLLLANLAGTGPIAMVASILVNAYIGTGLAMALLVFYRSRVLVAAQAQAADVGIL